MATVKGYPTGFGTSSTKFYSQTNTNNMSADNDSYASFVCASSNTKSKAYLNYFEMENNIPSNAVITAMRMEYRITKESNVNSHKLTTFRCYNGTTTKTADLNIDLVCDGNHNSVDIPMPFEWTPEEINNKCISIALEATGSGTPLFVGAPRNNTLNVYYMRIVVDYTLPEETVNKVYIGTNKPKEIYVGTQKVKAVYAGTTKIYG